MRVVLQRASEASVTMSGKVAGSIGPGLVVLAAFEEADTAEDIQWMSGKIARLRVFNDEQGRMNRSLQEISGELLIVSQFTLYASTKKGNRPSYMRSAKPEMAIPLYEQFVRQATQDLGRAVQTGEFGAHMEVRLVNDGPVTLLLDSRDRQ